MSTPRTRAARELQAILAQAVTQGPAAVVVTDSDGVIAYVNRTFCALTGYTPSEVLGRPASLLKSGFMPADGYRALWQTLRQGKEWSGEFHNRRKDGGLYWELAAISPVRDADGRITHFLKIAEDVTERKRLEADLQASVTALSAQQSQLQAANEQLTATTQALRRSRDQLRRLAQRDTLTGLLNRRGFAAGLRRVTALADRQGRSVGFLLIDVDRFKQLNDRLGHAAGDRVLKRLAALLRRTLRASDLACRYGGDELLVALPSADAAQTLQTAERLREAVRACGPLAGVSAPPVTLSIGAACSEPAAREAPLAVIRRADRALYRVKAAGRDGLAFEDAAPPPPGAAAGPGLPARAAPPACPQAVALLLDALDARDPATAAHCRRVAALADLLAGALGLSPDARALLLQSAWLHDIGKLAVPDAVLLKPGRLNAAEQDAVREHARLGHTLLARHPELAAAADAVLQHHERLDGSGYPQGLKGRQLSRAARILAVADTYDALRSERPYSRPRPAGEALRELQRGRGALFDPRVVAALARHQAAAEGARALLPPPG